jgi:cyclophilin family peptidyl-prolyl cis-trans isomerase/HEAT repeat protein
MRFIQPRAGFVVAFVALSTIAVTAQPRREGAANVLLQLLLAEDERRWDGQSQTLLSDKDPRVRKRAALAAGRIGDKRAVAPLTELLRTDPDEDVRQMAAFAIGEIESPAGADALLEALNYGTASGSDRIIAATAVVRARAVEALGKIAATLPDSEKDRHRVYGEAILKVLQFEDTRRSRPDRLTILLGLTATLRAKPDGAGPVLAKFVSYSDSRIVADALNALTRLHLKDGNEQARELLLKSSDPIVRANAARVLGATEDKQAFDAILDRALHDDDLRVRVSAIRALGSLKDARAAPPLIGRGDELLRGQTANSKSDPTNELLEIATTLGRTLANSNDKTAIDLLIRVRQLTKMTAPEVEIALARVSPEGYVKDPSIRLTSKPFAEGSANLSRQRASVLQALGELGNAVTDKNKDVRSDALRIAGNISCVKSESERCFGDTISEPYGLRVYAQFKATELQDILRRHFDVYTNSTVPYDAIQRATAAELLAELPPNKETSQVLVRALPVALRDEMNDAALAILDALAKQKNDEANAAIKTALDSSDHLIRRKAVALLKANGVGDFSNRIATVKTRNTEVDYRRAIERTGKHVTVTVETSKGSFVIEFLSADAPLTVDNFIQLAKKGFFNGQTIPRVVPNFVIQAGDPRGDTNGGPGYQIRCEINEVPYERAAVGMALSGKDTGGSQWFVTHSPQPHLDGGYTVFGHVIRGMEVVDNIARGDVIRRVVINDR